MMRQIRTVARQELRGFVDHPTAYVLAVAFLGLTLYLAFRNLYAMGAATLRPVFGLLPVLLAVFVPAVTMRSLAEERRGHTLDWLMAQPLTEGDVVLGKFLGNWLFVLLTLAGTLPTAAGVLLLSDADPGIVLAQYVGAALLAAQFVAIGLWASSVTRNQITAFIVAAVLCFGLYLIGLPVVQIGLPPLLSGALARLSVTGHFENVARGVVDLRDVLYFVSIAALFVVLATMAVARDRLSALKPDWARARLGAAVVAVIVVTANLLGSHVRGRLDLTRDQLFTLADGTRELLGGLDDLVHVTLFASAELPPEVQLQLRDVRDLLADMRRAGDGNLVVSEVDPDRDEDAAEQASSLGIGPVEFNVLRDDEFQVRRGYYGLAVTYADEREVFGVLQRTDDLEFRLASAIAKMTSDEQAPVTFMTGAGARSPFQLQGLRESLADRYDLQTVALGDTATAFDPDSTRVLVVAGPESTLDSLALARVESYLDGGGSALFLLDPVVLDPQSPTARPVRTGLEDLLEARGVRVTGQLVADLASSERVSLGRRGFFDVVAPYPLWPVVQPAGDHVVTRGLSALTLGWAGALEITDTAAVTPLWTSTEAGALRGPMQPIFPDQEWTVPSNELAPRVVAAALDPGAGEDGADGGRIIVVADESFAEGQFPQVNGQNLVFLANAIDWLAQDESLIRIRSKDRTPPSLVFTSDFSRGFLKWGNLAGVPLLFALAGVVRVTGRVRRARSRWKEVVA